MNKDTLEIITLRQLTNIEIFLSRASNLCEVESIASMYGLSVSDLYFLVKPDLKKERAIVINRFLKEYKCLPLNSENIDTFIGMLEQTVDIYTLMEDCLMSGMKMKTAVSIFKPYLKINKRALGTHHPSNFDINEVRSVSISDDFQIREYMKGSYKDKKYIQIGRREYAELLLKISKETTDSSITKIESALTEHEYRFELTEN